MASRQLGKIGFSVQTEKEVRLTELNFCNKSFSNNLKDDATDGQHTHTHKFTASKGGKALFNLQNQSSSF